MTLPTEELMALKRTRKFLLSILERNLTEFLLGILERNLTEIRKDARSIRDEAARCLRHYPLDMTIDALWAERISGKEHRENDKFLSGISSDL